MTMGAFGVFVIAVLAVALIHGKGPLRLVEKSASQELTTTDMDGESISVPLLLELLGTALESGLAVQGALRVVAQVAGKRLRKSLLQVVAGLEIGASWQDSWAGNLDHEDLLQIHDALSFGALTGASAAPLLYAQAQHFRADTARKAQKRAAALGVKLVLPLGLCSLPAFIALGVVPVVMAMIPVL